jgi:hypothetical protein
MAKVSKTLDGDPPGGQPSSEATDSWPIASLHLARPTALAGIPAAMRRRITWRLLAVACRRAEMDRPRPRR